MGILLLKLGYLFFKFTTIKGSKPLMSLVLARAQHHPYFVDSVMVPTANWYNEVEGKLKMWLLKKFGIPAQIEVLNRDQCIEMSTYLIAELFSIAVASYFILSAFWSSREKQLEKEKKERFENAELWQKIEDLRHIKEEQNISIVEMSKLIDKMKMGI